GVLPALLLIWIRSGVPESPVWRNRQAAARQPLLPRLMQKDVLRNGILATVMNACGMFGYWGLYTWIPAYLSLPPSQGGRGLNLVKTTTFFVTLTAGKWLGYVLFGFFADAFGRRKPYFAYLTLAAIIVPVYGAVHTPLWLLV